MASLKKLAGQTMWYGVSSIFARFLNYLLTPYLTYYLSTANYGEMSLVYSAIPFINVVFTYGMETTYFRFSNKDVDQKAVFNTASLSLLFSTLSFTALILFWNVPIAEFLKVSEHPEFITWSAWIIALDTISTLPFAKLRNEGRPRKYAFIQISGILTNIVFVVFFYTYLPDMAAANPGSFWASIYDPQMGPGYVILANLAMAGLRVLLLLPELFSIRFEWDGKLWKEMIIYSLPLMIAGFGGMVNETFDRIMLGWWAPVSTAEAAKIQVGIYSACYKLSILITLFIQAFRMGAEPFFFQQAKGEDAPKTYARVMNYFVITLCLMFLSVALYLDVWKQLIRNTQMWEGLKVVPILLIANMCLGVYYNLSIWYKLSHNTKAGATITLIGAGVTLLMNAIFIPYFGYMACAWTTLACYGSMMLISYFWGQKAYPVPYAVRKLSGFFIVMLLCFFVQQGICMLTTVLWVRMITATVLIVMYMAYIFKKEAGNLKQLPIIGKRLG